MLNIKYSEVTKKTMREYWENIPEENKKESRIRIPIVVNLKSVIFLGMVFTWLSYVWPYLKKISPITPCLFSNTSFALLIAFIIWIIIFKMVDNLARKIFPNYSIRSRYMQARKCLDWVKRMLVLQTLLKEKNVIEIYREDGDYLTVKYACKNGVSEKQSIYLGLYYNNVVKEDCLDFTWIKDEINKILVENKLSELVV